MQLVNHKRKGVRGIAAYCLAMSDGFFALSILGALASGIAMFDQRCDTNQWSEYGIKITLDVGIV